MTKSVLDRIKTGDFDGTITDRELCSDVVVTVPEPIEQALTDARAAHAALLVERGELPAKLNQANRAANLDESKQLKARSDVIYKEIVQAERAVEDAEIAVREAQLVPLKVAIAETRAVIAELDVWQQRIVQAKRRRDALASKADGLHSYISRIEEKRRQEEHNDRLYKMSKR